MAAAARQRGTVKWFNDTKGFGFISPEDGSEDLFVHQSSIKSEGFRSLAEGEEVEFSVSEGDDGRTKAVDVTGPDGSFVKGGSGGGGSSSSSGCSWGSLSAWWMMASHLDAGSLSSTTSTLPAVRGTIS